MISDLSQMGEYFNQPLGINNSLYTFDSIFRNFCEIDFRKIANSMDIPRATNYIHSYPAKMLQSIPFVFFSKFFNLNHEKIALDPYCGTGTVLLAAKMNGINSVGVDINPISKLITKVKTTPIEEHVLEEGTKTLYKELLSSKGAIDIPDIPNMDFWFSKEVQQDLVKIKECIGNIDIGDSHNNTTLKNFFNVCFSSTIRKVSFADPGIAPPVKSKYMRKKIKNGYNPNTLETFIEQMKEKSKNVLELNSVAHENVFAEVIGDDSRHLPLKDYSVDFVITSPPYLCAQKYFRSTRLELFWLDLLNKDTFVKYDKECIGTERVYVNEYKTLHLTGYERIDKIIQTVFQQNPERAFMTYNYFHEMEKSIKEIHRVLKTNTHFVLLIGNNEVCNIEVPSHKILSEIAINMGFEVEYKPLRNKIVSRGLMTKRNKTAGMIDSEWVLIFKK